MIEYYLDKKIGVIFILLFSILSMPIAGYAAPGLCLDGFCIGQHIQNRRFDDVKWITPNKDYKNEPCAGIGCRPNVAFRGYSSVVQKELSQILSWQYGSMKYNIILNSNLTILRKYKYECDQSPRGVWGQRRFFGAYDSEPSHYLTIIGLRLIHGKLTVYRIARQYPYHNKRELLLLARRLFRVYGDKILFYGYLSSNAYADVIRRRKDGWFGRSTMFNPTDLSDNKAELVLIDPKTRNLLIPSSIPQSGEIKPLPQYSPSVCDRNLPIQ